MRIVVVGIGSLGSAVLKSLLRAGWSAQQLLMVSRRNRPADPELAEVVSTTADRIAAAFGPDDLVVLAVKPADAVGACGQLGPHLNRDTVVLSMMAGVSVERLTALLGGHPCVVRAMPNLGVLVGQSVTVYRAAPTVPSAALETVQRLLSVFGYARQVVDERLLDVATAISGSGPAYLCWVLEQLEAVGIELGFAQPEAHTLALQTLLGTATYLRETATPFGELRSRVTSPAGTTAAAVGVLESRDAAGIIKDAVRRAFTRAQELGEG